MISGRGRENADELLEHSDIAKALDSILVIPGLRAGFWLKMMHNVIYTRCNEETWDYIAGSASVDSKTVQALEKKCPRYSKNDEQQIERLIDDGLIFEDVEVSGRPDLKRRLAQLQVVIPSLDTFFDDWKILKDCSLSLSNLIFIVKKNIKALKGYKRLNYVNSLLKKEL
ncbi:hypothetical protein MAC_04449 [Metarhizium acridum CQMa 102]|uniref:Uncharacterized protein n=1 Tax=Metarhizium acridum (strain CQMa 102) TaxID=655827 RepID=E9E3K1_METAQ|nr:uncharacterized protein MAC_04449 [Metarhizium acridum CQMa 102]EFY89594.1 hypothetical protein MAC_04449 [Metarhizium acridum CQMa 102]